MSLWRVVLSFLGILWLGGAAYGYASKYGFDWAAAGLALAAAAVVYDFFRVYKLWRLKKR